MIVVFCVVEMMVETYANALFWKIHLDYLGKHFILRFLLIEFINTSTFRSSD